MSNINEKISEIERKINLIKLMIEKRRGRIVYYEKLIKMGLTFNDRMRLDYYATIKENEIKDLTKELDWLYMQKSLYELQDN